MTENEKKLLDMIHNHPDPEKAFLIALDIVFMFVRAQAIQNFDSDRNYHH